MTTGAVAHAFRAYIEGWDAFLNPNVQEDRIGMIGGTSLLVLGVIGLGFSAWSLTVLRGVSNTGRCPLCGGETKRIRRHPQHRVFSWFAGQRITRRKCKSCSWKGLSFTS